MDLLITGIAFIVIFSILVLIHEWGHFYAARKSGIKVEEFGIGMPPRIWGFKKKDILWSVNWIPFGGFVRLLGEDATDSKVLKDKRSYAAQPARVRILVVTAGVLMNLLLAIFLLTLGFTFGIQPLILSADEVLDNLDKGTIHTQEGIIVKTVKEGSPAAIAGMMPEDELIELNGREIVNAEQLERELTPLDAVAVVATVERDGQMMDLNLVAGAGQPLGFESYELLFLPRVVVMEVKAGSSAETAGIRSGDVILKVNEKPVYFVDEYEYLLRTEGELNMEVMRGKEIVRVNVPLADNNLVVISSVFPDTPAETAGVKSGDVLVSVNGQNVSVPEEVVAIAQEHINQDVIYKVRRDGKEVDLSIVPSEGGLIGVGLALIKSYKNEELSVYAADFPVSVLKIDDVRYPIWEAPFRAVEESMRLSVLTVDMFGQVVRSLVTQFAVPEGVAGPVGIAQLTHVFVQEGILSLIRFMALLSLSLAIINILPFPALDGGRLLFILVEVITGRKVGAKFEAWIHALGFLILMFLLLMVTYSDILRFF